MVGQMMRRCRPVSVRFAAALLPCMLVLLCLAASALAAPGAQGTIPAPAKAITVPVKGMVTVVDLGSDYCVPCRMMAPVLRDAEREYKGRAAVVFLDVQVYREEAVRLGVRVIPTQIFYDKNGREVSRHEGFMDKKALSAKIDELLKK